MFLFGPLAFLAIVYAWATASFPLLARRRAALAAVLASLWLTQVLAYCLLRLGYSAPVPRGIVEFVLFPLIIAAFPLGVLRLVSWAAGRWMSRREAHPGAPAASMSRRQVIEATTGLAALGTTGSLLGWGMVRGRHAFELNEVPVRIAGLPRALDGYVIAQVSDIHAGTHVGERELNEGLTRVREARPDLVVVTGDIVDFDSAFAPLVARKLADLAPRDGVAAVLGNHDYYADTDEVTDALRAAGLKLLVNEGCVIRGRDGGGFALLGVDDRWSMRYGGSGPRLDRALSMVGPELPRVLLSHQPPTVDLWAGQVALQMSGHTHGGQINFGFRAADVFLKYVAGRYSVGATTLYVNRGFGTVGPPSRVGAPPEVTRLVLVSV
jgi:predicted MPP superfamily phosphohydrolase